jgi:hypothetical protein
MVFDKDTLVAIYESQGRVLEIPWPSAAVLPTAGRTYTMQSSRLRPGQLRISVVAPLDDGRRAKVQLAVAVDLPVYLGKGGGYTTKKSHAMRAFRPANDKGSLPMVPEDEPESLTRSETAEMARRTRYERVEGRRTKLTGLYENLAELRTDPDFSGNKSDLKFVESLVRKLEKQKAKDDADYLADLEEAS